MTAPKLIPEPAGLQSAVAATKKWRGDHAPMMSQADVNVLAAIVATETYANKSRGNLYIEFMPGRTDCNPQLMPARTFPDAADPDSVTFLRAEFGLTDREAVALLGAHSVGEMHAEISGYGEVGGKKWDVSPDSMDNKYYQNLLEDFHIEELTSDKLEGGKSSQWLSGNEVIAMLHADIGIMKDFTTSSGGHRLPSCQSSSQCPDASTAKIVREFSGDQFAFYAAFKTAFKKMINN